MEEPVACRYASAFPSSPKHPLHQCGNKPTLFRTASPALARLLCLASGRGAHAPDDGPAGAGPAQASLTFSAARSVVSLTFSAVRAAASLLLSTPRTAASLAFSAPRFTAPAVSLMPFLILSVVFPIIVLLCYVDAIRVAHNPAPGGGLCRTSQRVQGGGHTGKDDGAVWSVLYTHVAAKTMPRVSPRRNTPGKGSPCGWDTGPPCVSLGRCAAR